MVFSHGQSRGPVVPPLVNVSATFVLLIVATLWSTSAYSDGHLPTESSVLDEGSQVIPHGEITEDISDIDAISPDSGETDDPNADYLPESGADDGLFLESDDLDTDIGALEEDLMNLNMELRILEEDILYPASSRIAVYLSMDTGQLFQLDSVSLKLNNKEVSHHLYTERQVAALHQGGVQRLYVGNARQGENELTAVFIGKGPEGRDYTRATAVDFDHGFEPVFIQLSIMDDRKTQQPGFSAEVVR